MSEPQQEAKDEEAPLMRPTLTFESITFSDGQTLTFDPDEIVVFVGPNNAGKSAALRELQEWIKKEQPQDVIIGASFKKTGSGSDLREYLEKTSQKVGGLGDFRYEGMGYKIYHAHVDWFDNPQDRHPVAGFFSGRLATESRIIDSDPAGAIALYSSPPTHPIHLLLMDDKLASKMSALFRRAFGQDLIVFRGGGSTFPLYVGEKPALKSGEDELSRSFIDQLRESALPLASQGDGMRSFATVLIHALAAENHSVQFLDEPEAFLHPPQARLLGEFIARERSAKSQLFIATHSTDVLDGLMAGDLERVRIIRIQRVGDVNRVKELSREKTKAISTDTLTRYSGVFRGIFYKNVFLAESDSDCLFYSSILNLPNVSGSQQPDVMFVHAAGKHRMARMAETLRSLDVAVSVIADVDLISNGDDLKCVFESLGGSWADIAGHCAAVRTAVEALRPPYSSEQVREQIESALGEIRGAGPFPRSTERTIKQIFKSVSPWSAVKQAGRAAIRGAQAIKHYDQLIAKCSASGLWIVPVGELEGFCRSIEGSHGPGFVQKVLEERDLEVDPELEGARKFIQEIWASANRT